jgi:predicted permease
MLTGVVVVLAGAAPALYGTRAVLRSSLAEGARGSIGGVEATHIRSLLVTAEMALSVVALTGAGLFYQSVRETRGLSPGFDAHHVAMASVSITLAGYDSAQGEHFLRDVAERIGRDPAVSGVSYTDYVPLSIGSGSWEELRVEGYAADSREDMKLYRSAIGPAYFGVLGIPVLAGREFTPADDSLHAPVMIVSEAFTRHFLPGRAALGVKVHGWGRWFTIVGVVKDVKNYRLTDPPTPYFYVPVRQVYRPEGGYTFLVRTAAPVEQAVRTIANAVRSTDPTVPVFDAMALADYIEGPLQGQRIATRLLALLAGLASVLAAIGLYGVVAYTVGQRTREIGVRMALGARRADVLRVVAVQGGRLLGAGLVVGLLSAVAVVRLLSSMLYAVGGGDVAVLAGAAAVMVVTTAAAISVPARRAMNVDPVVALRAE